jgi:hypothetical protein
VDPTIPVTPPSLNEGPVPTGHGGKTGAIIAVSLAVVAVCALVIVVLLRPTAGGSVSTPSSPTVRGAVSTAKPQTEDEMVAAFLADYEQSGVAGILSKYPGPWQKDLIIAPAQMRNAKIQTKGYEEQYGTMHRGICDVLMQSGEWRTKELYIGVKDGQITLVLTH